MQKLLTQYRSAPSEKLANRIRVYAAKHTMARCFLNADDLAILKSIGA